MVEAKTQEFVKQDSISFNHGKKSLQNRSDYPFASDDGTETLLPWVCEKSDHRTKVGCQPHEVPDKHFPTCCGGAAPFLLQTAACCTVSIIIPIVFIILACTDTVSSTVGYVVPSVLFGLGFLYLLWGLRFVIKNAISPPDDIEHHHPFCEAAGEAIPPKRILLIGNPYAGKEKAKSRAEELEKGLKEKGIEVKMCWTDSIGHATEIIRDMPPDEYKQWGSVVCAGGDGTLSEVVNGMIARQHPNDYDDGQGTNLLPVTILPCGSGNALWTTLKERYRTHGSDVSTYRDADTVQFCIESVAKGHTSKIDAMRVTVNGKNCVGCCLILVGLVANCDLVAEHFRWMGPIRQDLCAIWECVKKVDCPCAISMELDNGETHQIKPGIKILGCAINLIQHWQANMRCNPYGLLDDGLMELFIIWEHASVSRLLGGFVLLEKGIYEHADPNAFSTFRCKKIMMEFDAPGVFNVDGECIIHDGKVEVSVMKQKLKLLGCRHTDVKPTPTHVYGNVDPQNMV